MAFMALRGACVLLLAAATLAPAQQQRTDSALVRLTLAEVFSKIGPELVELVEARSTQHWRIDLPKTTPAWVSASDGLSRLLNPPTPTANGQEEHYLTIQEQVVSDTLHTLQITIGKKWRCSGHSDRWVASERSFEIRLAMRDRVWQRVPSNSPLIYRDPGICEP